MVNKNVGIRDAVELGYNASQGKEKLREYLESQRRPEPRLNPNKPSSVVFPNCVDI